MYNIYGEKEKNTHNSSKLISQRTYGGWNWTFHTRAHHIPNKNLRPSKVEICSISKRFWLFERSYSKFFLYRPHYGYIFRLVNTQSDNGLHRMKKKCMLYILIL